MQQLRKLNSASEPNLPLSSSVQALDRRSRPSSVIAKRPPTNSDEGLHESGLDAKISTPKKRNSPLIRFRSRVRITSGVAPRERTATGCGEKGSSSGSGSPAPSIYAPLRSESDNEQGRWGSLGRRVNTSSTSKSTQRRSRKTTERGRKKQTYSKCDAECDEAANERTPLMGRTLQPTLELRNMVQNDDDVDEGTRQLREIDVIFGGWPERLLNRYWWWWWLEPTLCCHCLDESDAEW